MRSLETGLPGLVLAEPEIFSGDERGFFQESYRKSSWEELGVTDDFVQENHSRSVRGVVRGLHFAVGRGQAKLVRCVRGAVWDVAVDLRRGETFGRWEGYDLTDENGRQLYIPVGFAHGFYVASELADVVYRCSTYFDPEVEKEVAWDDPDIGIDWPFDGDPILSKRDQTAPRLADVRDEIPF
jgi:dTDP-4-dehydrorhamnose 3,5-epimerase